MGFWGQEWEAGSLVSGSDFLVPVTVSVSGSCTRNLTLAVFHITQARVVQKVDNAIHGINHYPADSVVCVVNIYPLDSDLSGG